LAADGAPLSPVASFKDKDGQEVRLIVQRGPSKLAIVVRPKTQPALTAFLEATKSSVKVLERGSKRIGYIHVWTLLTPGFRQALADAVQGPLQDTDGLLLDLRDGFGGWPDGFPDPLYIPETRVTRTVVGNTTVMRYGYARPLVVLINGGSRSGKEMLSRTLQTSKRATLVGQTTARDVLGGSPFRISPWAFFEVPTMDILVDGERLEGNGTKPDVFVSREIGDAGQDLILESGVNVLLGKLSAR
jgi:carboxyl-terminal processing protease